MNIAGTVAMFVLFRPRVGGFEMKETMQSFVLIAVASAVLAAVGWWVWHLLDAGLGQSLPAQIVSLSGGLALGCAAFLARAGCSTCASWRRSCDCDVDRPDARASVVDSRRQRQREVERVFVLMTMVFKGDAAALEQYAADNTDAMRGIVDHAVEHGLIAHRFYASGDGQLMIVDEWPDAESFQHFFGMWPIRSGR